MSALIKFLARLPLHCREKRYVSLTHTIISHDDVIKWKHILRYWPPVPGIHRSLVNSPHKGQWRGASMFSWICPWINRWANNREVGDLRRRHVHYDVTIMRYHMLVKEKLFSRIEMKLIQYLYTRVVEYLTSANVWQKPSSGIQPTKDNAAKCDYEDDMIPLHDDCNCWGEWMWYTTCLSSWIR